MQKIKLLSQKEILKIAAGQVVDRPANVVKELVENSIDAGAKTISVYIEDGGKKLIRVVDDGCGMSKEDAKFCFTKHSTSKITSLDQLSDPLGADEYGTFGFRGEALASISAVSKITMTTKDALSETGTQLELENSEFLSESQVPFEQGTDFKIKDLFYNTPARQKFLKKSETENRSIVQLMQAFCLDYLDINFRLFIDGKQHLNCPETDNLIQRAAQIWDHNFAKNLLELQDLDLRKKNEYLDQNNNQDLIDYETSEALENNKTKNYQIFGAITNHQYYRYDRGNIFLFVNKRWVKNQEIQSALLKGYINVLPTGKYPAAFIFVEIDRDQVDVNYHPRKEEVKILHPRIITGKLQEMVRGALEKHLSSQIKKNVEIKNETLDHQNYRQDGLLNSWQKRENSNLIYSRNWQKEDSNIDLSSNYNAYNKNDIDWNYIEQSQANFNLQNTSSTLKPEQEIQNQEIQNIDSLNNQYQEFSAFNFEKSHQADPLESPKLNNFENFEKIESQNNFQFNQEKIVKSSHNIVGQFKNTYILIEKEDGLFFIDQHAAHERILYEIFSKRFDSVATVRLLFPQIISLREEDILAIEPYIDIFQKNGIELEVFGQTQIKIQSTPVHIKNIDIKELVLEVLSWIKEYQHLDGQEFFKKINENMHAQMACKAAIKAGDALTIEQMEKLLQDLEVTQNRFACPHGRPTGWVLTVDEIEKKFRRKL